MVRGGGERMGEERRGDVQGGAQGGADVVEVSER